MAYIEAVRQLLWDLGEHNGMVIHLTLVPYLSAAGELKTNHSAFGKTLMESGIKADVLVCRTEYDIDQDKQKLSCSVMFQKKWSFNLSMLQQFIKYLF